MTATTRWVRTWGASPQSADDTVTSIAPFEDSTLWQLVRISGGGRRLRLTVSNEFGTEPLLVGSGGVALSDADGQVHADSLTPVTFSGRRSITVPSGAAVVTDPIDLPVAEPVVAERVGTERVGTERVGTEFAIADVAHLLVALHLPEHVDACTCHGTFHALSWISPGNGTRAGGVPADADELPTPGPLTAVDVEVPVHMGAAVANAAAGAPSTAHEAGAPRSIVVIGDSRVDGIGSTPGADRRWTDILAERLADSGAAERFVVNHGIGGNRLLAGGIGPSVLARFDRDVLATPGLGHVVIAVGNDLFFSHAPDTAENRAFLRHFSGTTADVDDVIAGHIQLAQRSRMHGIRVIAATIAPYRGSEMYTDAGDEARRRVNRWMRATDEFAAVLDFDAVWRDPDDHSRIRSDLHAGDFIHGNDAGYRALAESIDLTLFA